MRYVARAVPRNMPIEEQFKKVEFTAKGINSNTENINTEPTYYTETTRDETSTTITDHVAPRWYLNTFMELMDSSRQERIIISGNLPIAWERDKFEPYALVRNRIDDEDLSWILSAENKKTPIDQLQEHTKLEREALQDILDTVELPRAQYRNYKGKLSKAVSDQNEFLTARRDQMARSTEVETLKKIGYSPEEVAKEEQYLTNRSRGMKTLDELGASSRMKTRSIRSKQADEMEQLLEARRTEEIESGNVDVTEDMLKKPDKLPSATNLSYRGVHESTKHFMYNRSPTVKGDYKLAKLHWWLEQTRRISRASDKIHGVASHNKQLQMDQKQFDDMTLEAARLAAEQAERGNQKGFLDPREGTASGLDMMRASGAARPKSTVDVVDDSPEMPQHQWAHTRHHPKRESQRSVIQEIADVNYLERMRKPDVKDEKIERNINEWLKSKYRDMDAEREEMLQKMELHEMEIGVQFDVNKIDQRLRYPIKLDDQGHLVQSGPPQSPAPPPEGGQANADPPTAADAKPPPPSDK